MTTHADTREAFDLARAEYVAGAVGAAWCKADMQVRGQRCREAAEMIRAQATALTELRAECERLRGDAARLDALEAEIAGGGPIVLHNGEGTGGIHRGLGLSNTNRSLRQAIDDLTGGLANG